MPSTTWIEKQPSTTWTSSVLPWQQSWPTLISLQIGCSYLSEVKFCQVKAPLRGIHWGWSCTPWLSFPWLTNSRSCMWAQAKCGLLMMQLQAAHANDNLVAHSPSFGCYHKASKTFLDVKAERSLTNKALKQKQSSISSPPPLNNDCWKAHKRKGPPHGSLPCLLMSRASFCTKGLLGMQCAWGTGGRFRLCPSNVPVGALFLCWPCMPCSTKRVVSPHCSIMRYETYLSTSRRRSAQTPAMNLVCSHWLVKHSSFGQSTLLTLLVLTSEQAILDYGTGGIFDIRVFHPSAPLYKSKEPSAL